MSKELSKHISLDACDPKCEILLFGISNGTQSYYQFRALCPLCKKVIKDDYIGTNISDLTDLHEVGSAENHVGFICVTCEIHYTVVKVLNKCNLSKKDFDQINPTTECTFRDC